MRRDRLEKSRKEWKKKAKTRSEKNREYRKKIKRLESKIELINKAKQEDETAKQQQKMESVNKNYQLNKEELKAVLVILTMSCVISYRGIIKLFTKLVAFHLIDRVHIYHFSSVINWSLRIGKGLLDQIEPIQSKWLAIIDMSMSVGRNKVMVILRLPIDSINNQAQVGVSLDDCECIGVKVGDRWNCETVREHLVSTLDKSGLPVGIIRDGGSDLKKGINKWKKLDNKHAKVEVIEDIGHVIARLLKGYYSVLVSFTKLIDISTKAGSKLRQTSLSCLVPPKLRTVGRFQSIRKITKWSLSIFELVNKNDQRLNKLEKNKLKTSIIGLSSIRSFIIRFNDVLKSCNEILKIFKTQGFNDITHKEIKEKIQKLKPYSKIMKGLDKWIEEHYQVYKNLGLQNRSLPVSSDIIESLFGKYKSRSQQKGRAEINANALTIPLFCGDISHKTAQQCLDNVSHKDLLEYKKTLPQSSLMMRYKL